MGIWNPEFHFSSTSADTHDESSVDTHSMGICFPRQTHPDRLYTQSLHLTD